MLMFEGYVCCSYRTFDFGPDRRGYDFIHLICQLFCKLISVWKCTLSLRDTVLQFFDRREGITEFLRHIIFCRVCSHAHRLIIILNDVLHILLVSALAEDKTDGLILMRLANFSSMSAASRSPISSTLMKSRRYSSLNIMTALRAVAGSGR